jgi:glutathione-regulated potassium-efflux system ancillary protein KefG
MAEKRILVLFAHPALERSRVNVELIRAAKSLDGVLVHDLYDEYPDFHIDVDREQALLLEHDVIVLHHPFYWYSAPAIVKEWMDLVLQYGFAYGTEGVALTGKWMLSAITTGGVAEAYVDGADSYSVRQFLLPFEQTARLCHMESLPPFVVHGTHRLEAADIQGYVEEYERLLLALRSDGLDPARVRHLASLNLALDPSSTDV